MVLRGPVLLEAEHSAGWFGRRIFLVRSVFPYGCFGRHDYTTHLVICQVISASFWSVSVSAEDEVCVLRHEVCCVKVR